jgi:hypothetical protein
MEPGTGWLCSTSSTRAKLLKSRPTVVLEGSSRVDAVGKDIETRAYKKGRRAVLLRSFLTLVGWEMLTETLSKLRLRHGQSRPPPSSSIFPSFSLLFFSSLEPHTSVSHLRLCLCHVHNYRYTILIANHYCLALFSLCHISIIIHQPQPRLLSISSISIVLCRPRSIMSSPPSSSTPLISPSSSSLSCPPPVLVSFVRLPPLSFCNAMYIADPRINVDPMIDQTPGVCPKMNLSNPSAKSIDVYAMLVARDDFS